MELRSFSEIALQAHRLRFAAAQLRELALLIVDVVLHLRDDAVLGLELLLEALDVLLQAFDLLILVAAGFLRHARGFEVRLERLDHLGLRVQALLERSRRSTRDVASCSFACVEP